MITNILPKELVKYFSLLNFNYINEVRLRANKPIVINVMGVNKFLTYNGLDENIDNAIICQNSYIS